MAFSPWVGLREGNILGYEVWESARSNVREGLNRRPLEPMTHL